MRQKRYPLLLDSSYPPEKAVLETISSVPKGDQTAFLRALIMLGHQEMQKDDQLRSVPTELKA
jgi:hypothetical protein